MIAYLDTSSLIKLYVEETGSDEVRHLLSTVQVVATSAVAYPEARAAFARLRRQDDVSPASLRVMKQRLDASWPGYMVVTLTPELARQAGDLAERYALRGFDALHLASFAAVSADAPSEVHFSSFDERLNRAARALAKRRPPR